MQRRIFGLIIAGVFAFGVVACSSSSKPSSSQNSPAAANAQITIQNKTFSPSPVKAESTVSVQNMDGFTHTVTADNGAFDVTVNGGSTATFKAPATAGTYQFHCNIHSSMHGTLTVT